jgi:hypothetical protein
MGMYWNTYVVISKTCFLEALQQLDIVRLSGSIWRGGSFKKKDTPFFKIINDVNEVPELIGYYEGLLLQGERIEDWHLSLTVKYKHFEIHVRFSHLFKNKLAPIQWFVFNFETWWYSRYSRRYIVSQKERGIFESFIALFRPVFGFVQLDVDEQLLHKRFGFQEGREEFNAQSILNFLQSHHSSFFLPSKNFPFDQISGAYIESVEGTCFILCSRGFGSDVLLYPDHFHAQETREFEPEENFLYDENQHLANFHREVIVAFELLTGEHYAAPSP